jgi:hypothetical protein
MKKHKTLLILLLLTIILICTIREKTYIEKITSNFLYSDNATLPPDPRIIKH